MKVLFFTVVMHWEVKGLYGYYAICVLIFNYHRINTTSECMEVTTSTAWLNRSPHVTVKGL